MKVRVRNVWNLTYKNFDKNKEKQREVLCAIGNGYFVTRATFFEQDNGKFNYPGTYFAGVYNRNKTRIKGKIIENEDLVNCPNWLKTNFKINNGSWINILDCEILEFKKQIDLSCGIYRRIIKIKDKDGQISEISTEALASLKNPHLGQLKYVVKPINYIGKISIKTQLDGNIINDNVKRYQKLNQKHLQILEQGKKSGFVYLVCKTKNSKIKIVETFFVQALEKINCLDQLSINDKGKPGTELIFKAKQGQEVGIKKIVSFYTSRKTDSKDPLNDSIKTLKDNLSYLKNLQENKKEWSKYWGLADVKIQSQDSIQRNIRLHIYHTLITANLNSIGLDASIPARGWHGEAYRGHIFWDEIFITPFYNLTFPKVTKEILMYRYRRLNKAREHAKREGFEGVMFPWQSASTGIEETPRIRINPLNDKWESDNSIRQYHISLAIAYEIIDYFNHTNDKKFMADYGLEMIFEICRFWADIAKFNKKTNKYEIIGAMGPNEYHEKISRSNDFGLKDNAYTNILAVWLLNKAIELNENFDKISLNKIKKKIDFSKQEITKWSKIKNSLNLSMQHGIISQYDGFLKLKELNFSELKKEYNNIQRIDRILKSKNDTPDNYQVSKQADLLMIYYLLTENELSEIIQNLGYSYSKNTLEDNFNYYLKRTSHGSTLSFVVHANVASLIGKNKESYKWFLDSLQADTKDVQGGTTQEGIHLGLMTSTVTHVIRVFLGLRIKKEGIYLKPSLPNNIEKIAFNFKYKGILFNVKIDKKFLKLKVIGKSKESVKIFFEKSFQYIGCDKKEIILNY
ncbi:MAG: glycoside hydrolase family 65 protein [Candidatus Moranbacteria bacterium]|nr:glycoside hydrolase family 65 protein [Candidatus Moranbacteria bacterium]